MLTTAMSQQTDAVVVLASDMPFISARALSSSLKDMIGTSRGDGSLSCCMTAQRKSQFACYLMVCARLQCCMTVLFGFELEFAVGKAIHSGVLSVHAKCI